MSRSLAATIKALDARMNDLAHGLAGGAKTWEDYLLGVGRYREVKSLKADFEKALKSQEQEDTPDAPEEFGEEEVPARRPVRRAAPPRGWGGGG